MRASTARRVRLGAVGMTVAIAAGLVLAFSGTDSPRPTDVRDARAARADASDDPPSSATTTAAAATTTAPLPLEVVVDTSVQPAVTEVEGFADASAPRPVGRVLTADGTATDVVLDEVQLLVPDLATLDAFVARWGGTVTDVTEPDTDGMRAALVHIDVDRADPAALPADLIALEPDHSGTMRVSSDRVQRLYAAIAADAVAHGTIVSPNTLGVDDAIVDGTTKEWDGFKNPDAFGMGLHGRRHGDGLWRRPRVATARSNRQARKPCAHHDRGRRLQLEPRLPRRDDTAPGRLGRQEPHERRVPRDRRRDGRDGEGRQRVRYRGPGGTGRGTRRRRQVPRRLQDAAQDTRHGARTRSRHHQQQLPHHAHRVP